MELQNENSILIKCECHAEGIIVEYDPDGKDKNHDLFFISGWRYKWLPNRIPFLRRVKIAFNYVFNKDFTPDEIVLDVDKAKELVKFINDKLV